MTSSHIAPLCTSLFFMNELIFCIIFDTIYLKKCIECLFFQLTKGGLFFLPEDSTVESDDYFTGFTGMLILCCY